MSNVEPKVKSNYVESKILVFAGTYEGRRLCETLSTCFSDVTACVATEYGKELLVGIDHVNVLSKRLDAVEMLNLIKNNAFELVIDATHPYAKEVTTNIKSACEENGTNYERLLRDESHYTDVISVEDTRAAVEFLETTVGNVLITTGSKELSAYCRLTQYKERLFVRVLPSVKVLEECESLGFSGKHIIAMQGPFSYEINAAMLKQYNCSYIVTKSTGLAGGVDEKISAALQVGAKAIVIDRPIEQNGSHSFSGIMDLINQRFNVNLHSVAKQRNEFFPLFIPSSEKKALVVGAGKIGLRRVKTLLQFMFNVTVISIEALSEIEEFAKNGLINLVQREIVATDVNGYDIVIAATSCRSVNHMIGEACRVAGVEVSVADAKDECSFYFPAVVIDNELVVGVTSGGQSHTRVKQAAQKIRGILS